MYMELKLPTSIDFGFGSNSSRNLRSSMRMQAKLIYSVTLLSFATDAIFHPT